MDGPDSRRPPRDDRHKILLAHLENAAIRSEPEPTLMVRHYFGNVVVIQSIRLVKLIVMSRLKAADAPAGITNPHRATGSRIQAADGSQFAGRTRGNLRQLIAGDPKQRPFGSARPDVSRRIFGHGPDNPIVWRNWERFQLAGSQSQNGAGRLLTKPHIARLAD